MAKKKVRTKRVKATSKAIDESAIDKVFSLWDTLNQLEGLNFTAKEFGRAIGVSDAAIYRWKNRERSPGQSIQIICDAIQRIFDTHTMYVADLVILKEEGFVPFLMRFFPVSTEGMAQDAVTGLVRYAKKAIEVKEDRCGLLPEDKVLAGSLDAHIAVTQWREGQEQAEKLK